MAKNRRTNHKNRRLHHKPPALFIVLFFRNILARPSKGEQTVKLPFNNLNNTYYQP